MNINVSGAPIANSRAGRRTGGLPALFAIFATHCRLKSQPIEGVRLEDAEGDDGGKSAGDEENSDQ